MNEDANNAKHHYNKMLKTFQSNAKASHHHELAHEHYSKAADYEKQGNDFKAEFYRSKAERHADAAEDYEKQPK